MYGKYITLLTLLLRASLEDVEFTFKTFGQGSSTEDIRQLALSIRPPAVVTPLTVDIIQFDGAPAMSHGGQDDDPRRGRLFQQLNQQER